MGRSGDRVLAQSLAMIATPTRAQIWLCAGITDMRKGMPGLSALVKSSLGMEPYSGDVFVFRGRRGDQIKVLWYSGDGVNLYIKRLERGRFIWPLSADGAVLLTASQFSMLCEAIDWRAPQRTYWPEVSVG